jgi:hypothetical protein
MQLKILDAKLASDAVQAAKAYISPTLIFL